MSRQPLASRSAVSQQHLASGGRHITGQQEQLAIAASGDGPLLQGGAGGALPLQGGAGSALSQQGGAGSALLPQGSVGTVIGMPEPAPTWPAHTDLVFQPGTNKILLTAQEFHVRIVIQDAIDKLHTNLLSIDAYPTLKAARDVIKDALLSSAKSHFPGTLHVHNRIQSDANYIAVITHLVRFPRLRDDITDAFNRYVLGSHFSRAMSKSGVAPSLQLNSLPSAHQLKLHKLLKVNYHHTTTYFRWHQV